MVNQQPNLDNAVVFAQLWQITNELRQKIEARFTVHPDPSTKDLEEYTGIDPNVKGSMKTFSGSEIDWLVHSLLRNTKTGFSIVRLTTWLKPHIAVPESMQKALFERDLFIRRSSAELDPGNKMAVQMLGNELTDKLVKALWGGDRILPSNFSLFCY